MRSKAMTTLRNELFLESVLKNSFIPESIRLNISTKQALFLRWTGNEALYGGAAGGGKSVALLMGALQFVTQPEYHALILRRTYQQLTQADCLVPMSHEWLGRTKAKWNESKMQWTFPSGATLRFGHMQHEKDKYNYQGAAYRYVAFDELTQFTESQYRYLFSRLRRRSDSIIPLRVRSGSNPGGIGHEWVKSRFVVDSMQSPKRRFFKALLTENPNLDQRAYRESLAELSEQERLQLEEGDWDAVVGGRFDVNAIQRFRWEDVSADLPGIRMPDNRFINLARLRRIITVDPASSEKETADFTVISAWAIGENGELFWLGCDRGRWDLTKIVPRIQRMTSIWQPHEVGIEAVMANNAVYKLARRTAMPVRKLSPTGPFGKNADKLVRALPAMTYMEDGRIWLPQGDPLFPYDDVLDELRRFTGDPDQDAHDDVVDTLSYAIMRLQNLDTHTGRAPSTAGAFAKGRESDESVLSGIEDAEEPKRAKQHKRNSAPRVMRRLR